MPQIRGILLDVDDTLVDTRGAFRHALSRIASDHLPGDVDVDDVLAFWRDDANGWYRAHTRGEMTHREQRMRRANDLHARFGGARLDERAYTAWDEQFEQYFREGWIAHPDAPAFVDSLDDAGIVYGGVSNADLAYQVLKLTTCGLSRVPMFVGVDTFGVGKPDPRVFHEGCRRLGLDPSEVAYVGDEPDIDASAARRAGLTGIWLDRPGARRSTDAAVALDPRIGRVAGLDAVLAALG